MTVTVTGALTDPQQDHFKRARPGWKFLQAPLAAHASGGATEYIGSVVIPFDCVLKAAWVVPNAAVSGADTNTVHLNLDDKGPSGATSTELANLDLTSGEDLTACAKNAISTSLSTAMTAGDTLALEAEKIGTGALAIPAGVLVIAVAD